MKSSSETDLRISGEGGIRTRGKGLTPYTGLANRRYRPLSHLSGSGLLNRILAGAARLGKGNYAVAGRTTQVEATSSTGSTRTHDRQWHAEPSPIVP